jgi:hypothetical protein
MVIDVETFALTVALAERHYDNLPPPLKTPLRAHAVHGDLRVHFEGLLPLRELSGARGTGGVELRNAQVAMDDALWPIDSLRADIEIQNGAAQLQYEGRALSGRCFGTGSVELAQPHSFDVQWHVANVELEDTLRGRGRDARVAGTLSSDGTARGRFNALPESLSGGGRVAVRDGRLLNLPVINPILATLPQIKVDLWHALEDRADVRFALTGRGVEILQGELVSPVARISGKGMIAYDSTLDVEVNAGVVEAIQSRLGALGALLGDLGEALVTCTVTGTIDNPHIGFRTLGLGER